MKIDEKIETPFGVVHFKGELQEEELKHVVRAGLMVLMAKGHIHTNVIGEDEDDETLPIPTIDPPETLQ